MPLTTASQETERPCLYDPHGALDLLNLNENFARIFTVHHFTGCLTVLRINVFLKFISYIRHRIWSLFLFYVCLYFFASFPELVFFKDDTVRDVMTNVLFCYAREHSRVVYKQVDYVCRVIQFSLFVILLFNFI